MAQEQYSLFHVTWSPLWVLPGTGVAIAVSQELNFLTHLMLPFKLPPSVTPQDKLLYCQKC